MTMQTPQKSVYPLTLAEIELKGHHTTMCNWWKETLILALLMLSTQLAYAGNINCWKNNLGIRECGSVVPPEYSQQRIEIVNERGLVIKVIEAAKSPEELAREREIKRLQEEEEAKRKEQERLDTILLNAYTTERDLILARDNNLKSAKGQIEITKGNLRILQSTLEDLQNRAANHERSGHKPPDSLVKEIDDLKKQITIKSSNIEKQESNLKIMEERFESDLQRFRQLKQGRIK